MPETLSEGGRRLIEALSTGQDAVYVVDCEGRCLMTNTGGPLGLSPEEIVGKRVEELFPAEVAADLRRRGEEVIQSNTARTEEELVVVGSEVRTYLSTKAPLHDAKGRVIGVVGISTDITRRTEAEKSLRRREALLEEAQVLAHLGSWEWNIVNDEVIWSEECYRIVGHDPEEYEPSFESLLGCVHPDDRARLRQAADAALVDGRYELEHRVLRPDGEVRVVCSSGRVDFDVDRTPLRMVGAVLDVTEQKRRQGELVAREALLSAAHELTGTGGWEWDIESGAVTWSDGMYRIFGVAPGEFDGTYGGGTEFVHPDEREISRKRVERMLETGEPMDADVRIVRPDGGVRVLRSRAKVVADEEGRPVRIIGALDDVTERVQAQRELVRRALHDDLTGLPNRGLLLDRLEHAIGVARRQDSFPGVLFLDLDHFKSVNDEQGHDAGDELLVQVAERLRTALRSGDTLARVGGDEFVVVCEGVDSPQDLLATAERLRASFAEAFEVAGRARQVTASIGVALAGAPHEDPELVVRQADRAMYTAKQRGRNRVEVVPASSDD
jgi:diguanylate cyclase (GGDEF)-like protein/PAS domain S-box-containing protein